MQPVSLDKLIWGKLYKIQSKTKTFRILTFNGQVEGYESSKENNNERHRSYKERKPKKILCKLGGKAYRKRVVLNSAKHCQDREEGS